MMTGLCICVLYYNVTRQRVMHDLMLLFLVLLYISGTLTGVYGPAVGFVFEPRHPLLAIWLTAVTPIEDLHDMCKRKSSVSEDPY